MTNNDTEQEIADLNAHHAETIAAAMEANERGDLTEFDKLWRAASCTASRIAVLTQIMQERHWREQVRNFKEFVDAVTDVQEGASPVRLTTVPPEFNAVTTEG